MLCSVPLKYTYLVKNKADHYIYESHTGLWKDIAAENILVHSLIPQHAQHQYAIIDNLNSLQSHVHSSVSNQLTVSDSRANEHLLHLQIDAPTPEAGVREHLRLLKQYQKFDFKSIIVDRSKFRGLFSDDSATQLKPEFQNQLSQLSQFCNVEILISNRVEYFNLSVNSEKSNELNSQNVYLYVLGDADDTTFAETRLRILMDTSLGLFVDSIEMPLSLVPLVGGMGFGNFKSIARETGVNLYLPSIVPELYKANTKYNLNMIFLSGMEAQVLLAKKLIIDVQEATEKEIVYKSFEILKIKKDLALVNRKQDLSAIMFKYGAFIQVSSLGNADSTVHVQANSQELIELAIGDFSSLSNEIYEGDIWFHTGESTAEQTLRPCQLIMPQEEFKTFLCKISIAANVVIYAQYNMASFKIIGSQDDILKAVKLFKTSAPQFYDDFKATVRFNIELGLSYHEFISGKKNGKIAKITNSSQCTFINFHPLNEYNLILEIESSDFADFINSFSQLQQEFPSEVKFYIPESFHRQIIGTGGTLIQSIMRKYNVFVKFSNSYDQKNNLKSHVRYDNVIIRCPFKNSNNIPLVKNELNSLLINNENVTFFNTYFKISRNQYRLMNFDKIQEIEKKTSTFIKFPSFEPQDFAIAEVLGTETHSINAARLLILEMAESYEFRITSSPNFHKLINDTNEAFVERIKVPFKLLYKIEVMMTDKKSAEAGTYHAIILSYPPDSDLFLEDAITHLTSFLREFEFTIMDRGELANNDMIMNGSASRIGMSSSAPTSSSSVSSTFSHVPSSGGNTAIPLQLPLSQQLYSLPSIPQTQRFAQQPTLVQPGSAPHQHNGGYKKRNPTQRNPKSYSGY